MADSKMLWSREHSLPPPPSPAPKQFPQTLSPSSKASRTIPQYRSRPQLRPSPTSDTHSRSTARARNFPQLRHAHGRLLRGWVVLLEMEVKMQWEESEEESEEGERRA